MRLRRKYYLKIKEKTHSWTSACLQLIFCLNGSQLPNPTQQSSLNVALQQRPVFTLDVPGNQFVLSVCKCVTSMMNIKHSKMKFLLYSYFQCAAAAEVKKRQHQFRSLADCTFFKRASARLLEVTTVEHINIQQAHVVFPVRSFC